MTDSQAYPRLVSDSHWREELEALLVKEKELTRALDALAAERRRLPMVRLEREYRFHGSSGKRSMLDLFDGRQQLLVYHFMFAPEWDSPCSGCSMLADSFGNLAHLHARDTSLVCVSRAPLEKLAAFKQRLGWAFPWYSSLGSDFNHDMGATTEGGEHPVLSVFLRKGDDIYLTYQTTARGLDRLNLVFNALDLTAFGRQETWEDSPKGWPQSAPYEWWRLNDEYERPITHDERKRIDSFPT